LPVCLHDARRQLQGQEKAHNKPHRTSTLMGRDVACVRSSTHRGHQNTWRKPTGGMVLHDLPQVGLRGVRAIWPKVAQRDSSDSHRILSVNSQDSQE
jgi:hypothetical protein